MKLFEPPRGAKRNVDSEFVCVHVCLPVSQCAFGLGLCIFYSICLLVSVCGSTLLGLHTWKSADTFKNSAGK